MPGMVVLGDRTDHGGTVIEASMVTDTYGKYIARVGDRVHCPKKGHQDVVIVQGDHTMLIDGRAVAYDGCLTSCGARLIAGQFLTTVEFGGEVESSAGVQLSMQLDEGTQLRASCPTDSRDRDALIFDEQFELRGDDGTLLTAMPYTIRLASGELRHGETDDAGRTKRYVTADVERLELHLGHV